jgi:hypothetical protein
VPSPPAAKAANRLGGSTAPLKNHLANAAAVILQNVGIEFGTRKIFRLVDSFVERAPQAGGHVFFQYLANSVQMSQSQRRTALANPDIARAISYSDPTGEAAVNNVMKGR